MAESKWLVIRMPSIPGDDGGFWPLKFYPNKAAAEAWIADQKGKYFAPSDYTLAEVPQCD